MEIAIIILGTLVISLFIIMLSLFGDIDKLEFKINGIEMNLNSDIGMVKYDVENLEPQIDRNKIDIFKLKLPAKDREVLEKAAKIRSRKWKQAKVYQK